MCPPPHPYTYTYATHPKQRPCPQLDHLRALRHGSPRGTHKQNDAPVDEWSTNKTHRISQSYTYTHPLTRRINPRPTKQLILRRCGPTRAPSSRSGTWGSPSPPPSSSRPSRYVGDTRMCIYIDCGSVGAKPTNDNPFPKMTIPKRAAPASAWGRTSRTCSCSTPWRCWCWPSTWPRWMGGKGWR